MVSSKKLQQAAANAKASAKSNNKNNNNDSNSLFDIDPLVEPKFENGEVRSFYITTPDPIILKTRKLTNIKEYLLITSLFIFASMVRLSNLAIPNSVVFDEVHFGGFARKYILGQFFMDVHPPLAKMLFAAVGLIGGFNGDFEFKNIADVYPVDTPYVMMRFFPACLGVATVLLCYLTLRNSGVRPVIAFITASCLIIENSNVTISRYILLDSPLLFFIAASIYGIKKFEIQIPFSFGWYKSLLTTGIALGLAVSSKWVGLFTISWVGLICVIQMWFILGDLSISTKKIFHHFFARGLILLGVPIFLYILFFQIHFQLLSNEGDGSPFMSSAFRSSLNGNNIPKDIVANVGLGSIVTLRHLNTQGGYLHSHNNFYPTGSKQQQITLYPHLDSNNNWLIEPYNDTLPNEFVPLVDGTKIRLNHVNSGRRLHSHDEKPPVSERDWQKEASCYGYEGFTGDANDDFIVEIVKHETPSHSQENVKALTTIFRLRHAMTGHYLFSSEVKLPDWGFEQQEVTTASQGYRPLTYWYVETNENSLIPEDQIEITNYPTLSLWDKIVESHKTMWKINQGLTEHHNWQSSPTEWPLLLRGINYWVKDHKQVYFIGNAIIWWTCSVSIVVFIFHSIFSLFKWQSGIKIADSKQVFNFNYQVFVYLLGWFLHYFPFYIMGRQLFLHHYIPAFYFALLSMGHLFDIGVNYLIGGYKNKTLQRVGYATLSLFLVFSLLFFVQFSSLIKGTPWTQKQCEASRYLSGWDFECNSFLNNLNEYSSFSASAAAEALASPIENPAEFKEAKETPYNSFDQQIVRDESLESEFPSEEENIEPAPPAEIIHNNENVAPPAAVDLEETNQ